MQHPAAVVRAVLFDLDGTFADTAPDMAGALNRVRARHQLPPLPLGAVRPHVSNGARGMVAAGFNLLPEHEGYVSLRDAFLEEYASALCVESRWFDGMAALVDQLEQQQILWGIVTNKATRYTLPLMDALDVTGRAACIVCGDTCARAKPHPDPLLHAARLIDIAPAHCLYVGDDRRDIDAANAAGMRGVIALYGYLGVAPDPASWAASAMVDSPAQIATLL